MSRLHIIAIGDKHDPELKHAIERYEKRLASQSGITWQLLPYSSTTDNVARRAESAAIASKIDERDFVVLLDERGRELTSEVFSQKLSTWQTSHKRIVFIIGGAYGVDDALRARADVVWSLSTLVFPHQLVRLMLVEQLYRAAMIQQSHPYHHV